MKITRIRIFKTGLPYVDGHYSWGGEITSSAVAHFAASTPSEYLINSTDLMNYNTRSTGVGGPTVNQGKLYATDTPGLGVVPDYESLGAPVATYGDIP